MHFLLNGTFGDFKRKTWWLQFTNYLDALYLPELKVTTKTLYIFSTKYKCKIITNVYMW